MKRSKARMQVNDRKGERGAALVTVLMISFLLILAVAALLLEASTNTANVTDATAEQQAYYAAESGIQTAVHILRHKPVPAFLLDPSKPATDPANQVTYRKARQPVDSNYPGDPNTTAAQPIARLSRWMTYDDTFPDGGRVVVGNAGDGIGYKVEVIDPDNVGGVVAFSTQGNIGGAGLSRTFPGATASDSVTITYHPISPASPTVVDVSSGIGATNFGKFEITATGAGALIPERVRFTINVNINVPYATSKNIRGYIEPLPAPGLITPSSLANVRIIYDSERFVTLGTLMSLTPPNSAAAANTPGSAVLVTEQPGDVGAPSGPYGTYVTGYRIYPYAPDVNGNPGQNGVGTTLVTGSFLSPEPIRLLVRSTGYASRGATKVLESVIQKNYFDDLGAPSPLTLIGPTSTVTPSSTFLFSPGTSRPIFYSGRDTQLRAFLPPIGVTTDPNLATVNTAISSGGFNGSVFGNAENVTSDLPNWLQSPARLDTTIKLLKARALSLGRYVGPAAPDPPDFGDYTTGTGITFVDRDVTIQNNTNAGGIIVVTGKITFQGGFNLKGLLVVTGSGGFERTGGGSGHVEGAIVVAPYNAAGLTCVANNTTCFLSPQYKISGGGASDFDYNSNSVANGLGALTDYVKGVAEK